MNQRKLRFWVLCVLLGAFGGVGCGDDSSDDGAVDAGDGDGDGGDGDGDGDGTVDAGDGATTFQVTIENVSEAPFMASGVFNTPVGAGAPGPLTPGGVYQAEFDAAPGSRLSFATMFVQSNDLFYAPDPGGLALFDDQGMPVDGDVTASVQLWDGGTEANEEPGSGANQAPRQGAAETGPADGTATVRLATDDFGNLPAVTDVIQVTVSGDAAHHFVLRIENVSDDTTLALGAGGSVAVPLAPGVWVVHSDGSEPLFTADAADRGDGLEALAEDGDPGTLAAAIAADVGLTSPLAPGAFVVHDTGEMPLFTDGEADRGDGLEALAEDGSPAGLVAALGAAGGAFDTPVGQGAAGPALPGGSYAFDVEATPGQALSLATMLVQTNDLFFAPAQSGIPLFDDAGTPVSGDITAMMQLWDAGTEVNQAPGVGADQAPRQAAADTGADEGGVVQPVSDAFAYPEVARLIKVTLSPQ